MLNFRTFFRKKSVLYTVFSVVSALFLLMLSFSYSYSVSAAAPSGGFGVGRNQGLETGINTTAFNAVRADINAGVYDRQCQPDEEDTTKWHSLVNVEKKCHYNHQHNDDPNYVNDIFGLPGAWFGSPGMEISYPWQTFKAATANEQNAAYMANHQMENDLKHEGYVWIVRRDQPCPNGNCVTDFRIQVHAVMGAADMPVRYHSFSLEARVCVNASDPSSCGIVRYGGWIDMGILVTRSPNDVNCGGGPNDIHITLPADTLYFPIDRPGSRDEVRCHPQITTLPPYPPTKPLAEWWGHAGGETRFQVRSYDPIGNVDAANPTHWQFFCAQADMNCHYDASMFSIFVGYSLHIHQYVGGTGGTTHVPVDANGDGRTDFKGYFNRWGTLNTSCTTAALDCVPFQYDNVVLNGGFAPGEAGYAQTACSSNCKPVDYDISPPGKRWITWFYRYADGGTSPTPVPTNPGPTTPAPTSPAPATPTPKPPTDPSLVVYVSPANANVNATINVDLVLWNVQNIYGVQTTCKVDPKVLQGAVRGDGDIFKSTNSFFVDKGFQADGSWVVGASRLQPTPVFAGNGIAFKLSFVVKAASASAVNCTVLGVDANGKEITLKVVNGSFNGAPVAAPVQQQAVQPTAIPTDLPTNIPPTEAAAPIVEPAVEATADALTANTVTTNASITGKMLYQNFPDNSKITVQLVTSKGAVVATVTTGADGSYTFKNVPVGTVGVTAIGNLYLRIGKVVTITAGQAVDLGSLTLPGGDTDNSGDISVTDASLIGANFDNAVNPAPASADVNGDGVINIRDLAIVGGNFGLKSPIIIK
jgi:hypothetical protein